jgi:outer membrane lipoprotein
MFCSIQLVEGALNIANCGKVLRRMRGVVVSITGGIALLAVLGCNTYDVIPNHLESQLAPGLTYETVQADPNTHQGKLVAWGGEVLAATRTKEGTRIEILQLPLTDDLHPAEERARSKGRFIAFDNEGTITDPAAVEPGTPVTIVGRIGPEQQGELQGVDYRYPRLDVLDMTVWEKKVMQGWRRWGPFGSVIWDPTPWTRYRSYRID